MQSRKKRVSLSYPVSTRKHGRPITQHMKNKQADILTLNTFVVYILLISFVILQGNLHLTWKQATKFDFVSLVSSVFIVRVGLREILWRLEGCCALPFSLLASRDVTHAWTTLLTAPSHPQPNLMLIWAGRTHWDLVRTGYFRKGNTY